MGAPRGVGGACSAMPLPGPPSWPRDVAGGLQGLRSAGSRRGASPWVRERCWIRGSRRFQRLFNSSRGSGSACHLPKLLSDALREVLHRGGDSHYRVTQPAHQAPTAHGDWREKERKARFYPDSRTCL